MKGKTSFWVQFFALAAGIVLICMHDRVNLVQWLIVFLGFMFAIPGVCGLLEALYVRKKGGVGPVSTLAFIGSLIVGILMIFWPGPFETIFVYLLAAALILGGFWHIWALAVGFKPYNLPGWLYVLPILVIIAGVLMLVTPVRQTESTFTLVAGIALVCIAANGLFMYLAAYDSRRQHMSDERKTDQLQDGASDVVGPEVSDGADSGDREIKG